MSAKKDYNRSYYLRHRDRLRKRSKKYYRENRERCCKRNREYAARNKATVRKRDRAYYVANVAKVMLNAAKQRARRKGVPFSITESDISVPSTCPVLGIPLLVGAGRPTPNSPSLDRLSPAKGYVRGNVAVISHRANTVKSDGTPAEHRAVADWLEAQVQE